MLSEMSVSSSSSSNARQGLLCGGNVMGGEDRASKGKLGVVSAPTAKERTVAWVPAIKRKKYYYNVV